MFKTMKNNDVNSKNVGREKSCMQVIGALYVLLPFPTLQMNFKLNTLSSYMSRALPVLVRYEATYRQAFIIRFLAGFSYFTYGLYSYNRRKSSIERSNFGHTICLYKGAWSKEIGSPIDLIMVRYQNLPDFLKILSL